MVWGSAVVRPCATRRRGEPNHLGKGRPGITPLPGALVQTKIRGLQRPASVLSTTTQGYLNIKGYKELENQNRPDGWNVWLTFVLPPAEQTPSVPPRRMITK